MPKDDQLFNPSIQMTTAILPNCVARLKHISPQAKLTFAFLGEIADRSGAFKVADMRKVAEKAGLSMVGALAGIGELERDGFLAETTSGSYQLLFHECYTEDYWERLEKEAEAEAIAPTSTSEAAASEAYAAIEESEYWLDCYNDIARSCGFLPTVRRELSTISRDGQITFGKQDIYEYLQDSLSTASAAAAAAEVQQQPAPAVPRSDERPIMRSRRFRYREALYVLGEEAGWMCVYCQCPGDQSRGPDKRPWHVDHLFAQSNDGDSMMDNLILACATCNLKKHAKLASEILMLAKEKLQKEAK